MENLINTEVLKEAFRKMLSYSYHDKTDMMMRRRVAEFAMSLADKADEDGIFENLLKVAQGKDNEMLGKWLKQMKMVYYPKKLVDQRKETEGHIVTNIPQKFAIVDRLLIKADMPIELCILDVAWILVYIYKTDNDFLNCSWGNRVELNADKTGVKRGNALFKKYQNQYGGWWREGLSKANEKLKAKQNVSIISFDITNCYHSIDFDFELFLSDYEKHHNDGIRRDPLTDVIISIYEQYWNLTKNCGEEAFLEDNVGKHPLPLSLMSAHVLANWYLKPLDSYILQTYQPFYYGRYVDDCMVVVPTRSKSEDWVESVEQELHGLLYFRDNKAGFAFPQSGTYNSDYDRLKDLQLQKDKVYVYRFNCQLPPATLEEFEENQKEHSSEFRFMTDDADIGAVNLESVTLVSALDAVEESGRRFNILEENKYKLSVYLAKLSSRLAKYGKDYPHFSEVDKIFMYFRDSLLIKHYVLWERLMTVFVLAGKKDYLKQFAENVRIQISHLSTKKELFDKDHEYGLQSIQNTLISHLEESIIMALSLNREDSKIDDIYLKTFMNRMHYNMLPMQEFCKDYDKEGVRLQYTSYEYKKRLTHYRWIPYYVKYYDIVMMLTLGHTYDPDVFEKAFTIYTRLNKTKPYVKATSFWHHVKPELSEFNPNYKIEDNSRGDFTVAVINMDLNNKEGSEQIKKYGVFNIDKAKTMQQILDKITAIGGIDIFVLPEMSLPIYELREFCWYSSRKKRAFVAGMEYVIKKRTVYNYIITCLPINLYGRMDAVPIIRLKNHYAPAEFETIKGHKMKVPKNDLIYQNLYHWRDHVFTTYYCYELSSIKERSYFYSTIDAMYCPVFNPDTFYFNNIAESMVRDMHCYFILSNVSHFGDSRVTAPMKHEIMNMLKVKGGNTPNNKAVVLTAKLDINYLRRFQSMTLEQQKKEIKDKEKKHEETFKITPPDYSREELNLRTKRQFIFKFEDETDEWLAGLNRMIMEY